LRPASETVLQLAGDKIVTVGYEMASLFATLFLMLIFLGDAYRIPIMRPPL